MKSFYMNGYLWKVIFVPPSSDKLADRTRTLRVATTDPDTYRIYLSNALKGEFLNRVLIHELGHATMISYGLIDDVHRMVKPEYWFEAEEWVCNFIADYGGKIFSSAYEVLGDNVWEYITKELDELSHRRYIWTLHQF